MSDNLGNYSGSLFLVGQITGDQMNLQENYPLSRSDQKVFAPGVGNRVNLYVRNGIASASTAPATLLDYGIAVAWTFFGHLKTPGPNEQEVFTRNVDSPGNLVYDYDPRVFAYQEQAISFQDSSSVGEDLKRLRLDAEFYRMRKVTDGLTPNGSLVIPLIARADFMYLFFRKESAPGFPGFDPTDNFTVWAMRGADAGGDLSRFAF